MPAGLEFTDCPKTRFNYCFAISERPESVILEWSSSYSLSRKLPDEHRVLEINRLLGIVLLDFNQSMLEAVLTGRGCSRKLAQILLSSGSGAIH
ncbi:MAG TPA: hypothetical protein DEA96_17480 [Leptospiraceae bacterium]|nr:hypothetical protein [Spirochaetaceae bacterium]HBS06765.1 hypothetical protein [Leptospiraceae bacterium]|tara:strand:+ start:100468 stop:100749 length:282 start_codon:yes stop_codon:yes gene_type:complete